jgi:hypothetical protein
MDLYFGLKTGSIQNPYLRLDYLLEGGLRIIRMMVPGNPNNFLAETPDFGWETPYGWYALRGGHRLWTAPQNPLTSIPEQQTLQIEPWEQGVRLTQPAEAHAGLCKVIEIQLKADRPEVVVHHRMVNESAQPVQLSAWAISQVPLGGRVILPQADLPIELKGAGPNRHLVFWPYTHLPDARLDIHDRYLVFDASRDEHEFKMGTFNPHGWLGYQWGNFFFRKQFTSQSGLAYPDMGSNVEIYCNHQFAEIETLSPFADLDVGESIEHTEIWELLPIETARKILDQDAQRLLL